MEDVAEEILLAVERYNNSELVNPVTDLEMSMKDLAELIVPSSVDLKGEISCDKSKPDG